MTWCWKKKVRRPCAWRMTADAAVSRRARAKINLTLHVTGQRDDGYHLLDSLVCFADIADEVTVAPAAELSLQVDGPMAAGVPADDSNLVMKAARLFGASAGARISLTKHLPNAAGIGGGSADAAATLRALSELWDMPLPEGAIALGADVPVCLAPFALRMRGVGEVLEPAPPLPETWAVLVNPGVAVATPPVFKALITKENPPMPDVIPCFSQTQDLARWCAGQRNDLQAPAMQSAPVIGDVLEALKPSLMARMSGSGATCFGLCADQGAARALAAQISAERPDWWVRATQFN